AARVLHVDPDEVVARGRVADDLLEVLAAEVVVELEPERRELHAHVRVEAALLDVREDILVGADDRRRVLLAPDLLAEDVDRGELPLRVQPPDGLARVLQLRAGDVALRELLDDRAWNRRKQPDDRAVEDGHGRRDCTRRPLPPTRPARPGSHVSTPVSQTASPGVRHRYGSCRQGRLRVKDEGLKLRVLAHEALAGGAHEGDRLREEHAHRVAEGDRLLVGPALDAHLAERRAGQLYRRVERQRRELLPLSLLHALRLLLRELAQTPHELLGVAAERKSEAAFHAPTLAAEVELVAPFHIPRELLDGADALPHRLGERRGAAVPERLLEPSRRGSERVEVLGRRDARRRPK